MLQEPFPTHSAAIQTGPGAGLWFALTSGTYRVGRSTENEIRILDPRMARKQLLLQVGELRVQVHNLTGHTQVKLDGTFITSGFARCPAILELGGSALGVERALRVPTQARRQLPPFDERLRARLMPVAAGDSGVQQRVASLRERLGSHRVALYQAWPGSMMWVVRASSGPGLEGSAPEGRNVPVLEEEILARAVSSRTAGGTLHDPLGGKSEIAFAAVQGGEPDARWILIAWRNSPSYSSKELVFLACCASFAPPGAFAVIPPMSGSPDEPDRRDP